MTMQMTLTYGTTTLNLQSGGYKLIDGFYPATISDGVSSVSERFDVLLRGVPSISEAVRQINRAFEYAREHTYDDDAVYLNWSIDNSATWRTRVYDGRVLLSDALDRYYRQGKARIGVALEHAPWWEGPEVQVRLTNPNGTEVTSALRVYSCNDQAGSAPNIRANYCDINGSDIDGDIPGATRLEMTNEYSTGLSRIYIGQSWHTPVNFATTYEAENSTAGTGITSNSVLASAGSYKTFTISNNASVVIGQWTLSAATLSAAAGQFVKPILVFFTSSSTSLRFHFELYAGSSLIWMGPVVMFDPGYMRLIREMPAMRLPPTPLHGGNLAEMTLKLVAENLTGGNVTMSYDYLGLLPVDRYRQLGTPWAAAGDRVVDDGINGVVYLDNGSGGYRVPAINALYEPIYLMPKLNQRLMFYLHSIYGDSAPIIMSILVKLFYRPRRLSV